MSLRPTEQRTPPSSQPCAAAPIAGGARLKAVLQLGVDATDAKGDRKRAGLVERFNPFSRRKQTPTPDTTPVPAPVPAPLTTQQKILREFYTLQQSDGDKLREAWKVDGAFRPKRSPYLIFELDDFGDSDIETNSEIQVHFFYDSNVDIYFELVKEFKLVFKLNGHVVYEMAWQVPEVDDIAFTIEPPVTAYRPLPGFDESLLLSKLRSLADAGPPSRVQTLKAPIPGTLPQPAGSV